VAYSEDAVPLAEKALIAEIRRLAQSGWNRSDRKPPLSSDLKSEARRPARSARHLVRVGIGDDCAVLRLPPGEDSLVTTDFTLENIHFRRPWHSPEVVGHRCLTRGLSDIAAMGGQPLAAFLSLALPRDVPQSWVRRFARSLVGLAKRYGVTLAGGDTGESPSRILADIIVLGTVPKGKAILRSGARPGDAIYVSGDLGGATAALLQMRAHRKRSLNPQDYPRHFYPAPRLELGRMLREKRLAAAMIDLSDGLSTDLAHICEESGVGAEIHAELIPRARVGKPARPVDLNLALHGGEDYELLFTSPAAKHLPAKIAGVPLTRIGQITRSRKMVLREANGVSRSLVPRGWEHFRKQ